MKLLMISGDRTLATGKAGAFSSMMEEFHMHFERIDIICPAVAASERVVHQVYGNVYIHSSPTSLLSQPFFIRKKAKELIEHLHHEVMTVHDYPPFYNGIGARLLRRTVKIPTALEIHHIVGWPKAGSFVELIGRWMSKWMLKSHSQKFDAVRTVSGTTKHALVSLGVPESLISIVPSFYLDHDIAAQVAAIPKKYDLVFCGRLVANKGLMETIDAMKQMPTATLLVIGDGPLKVLAERRVADLGLTSRVTFVGWLPTALDVAKAIASAKVLIMNSKSEGGPRVALEALSYGLPILATNVGVIPDVLRDGENGYFIDGSARDIVKKATLVLADSSRLATMSMEALKILSRFERRSAIKAYAEFLQELGVRF